MKKISVVIPVYNREDTISKCLYSVIYQTLNRDEMEIIVVDDCSTDKTYDILSQLRNRFPNLIKVIRLNENSGAASKPRNVGIENANAEYISFIDSDDTIHLETLKNNLEFIYENKLDGVLFSSVKNGTKQFDKTIKLCDMVYKSNFRGVRGIFNLHKIKKNHIYFNEKIRLCEDALFLYELFYTTPEFRVGVLADKVYYHYNFGVSNSISLQKVDVDTAIYTLKISLEKLQIIPENIRIEVMKRVAFDTIMYIPYTKIKDIETFIILSRIINYFFTDEVIMNFPKIMWPYLYKLKEGNFEEYSNISNNRVLTHIKK